MALSNTNILIKRSSTTNIPTNGSLKAGEFAYSYTSNTLFLGNSAGTGVINVGGLLYTQTIDAATNLNTASTLVKRDASGNFSAGTITASLSGNASTATKWQTARTLSFTGDATGTNSVDGSGDVATSLTLATSGVTAGSYGSSTQIPTFAVDAKGRVTSASNVAISTTINAAGNTGTGSFATGGTLTIVGSNGGGIATTWTDATDTFAVAVDSTVIRSSGAQAIAGDLSVTGNLIVTGTTTTVNTSTVVTSDSLIKLATNNIVGDVVDIGFYGSSNTGSSVQYHGLIREGSGGTNAGNFYLFKNLPTDPTNNVVSYASLTKGTLIADLSGSTGLSLTTGVSGTLPIANGGTNNTSFTTGQRTIFDGTKLASQANTTTTVTGALSAANTITALSYNAYGEITAYTGAAIAIDASQVSTGTLPIARGGTNASSFTNNQRLFFNGTSIASLANNTTTVTGGLSAANTITSVTVDNFGQVTAYTGAAIAIDASQVTTGTLGVARGGTGASSFTTNGITYGNGTGALQVTAAAGGSGTDQAYTTSILTTNMSGVPVWAYALDGGTF
jgi:hypothetical protein